MKNCVAPLVVLAILTGCGGGGSGGDTSSGGSSSGGPSGGGGGLDPNAFFNQALKWVDAPFGSPREVSPAALLINSVSSPMIDEQGRYVMFLSDDPNLVPNDTNGGVDLFVRDTEAGITVRKNVVDISDQSVTNVTSYGAIQSFPNAYNLFFSVANPENHPAGPRFYELFGNTIRLRGRGQIISRNYYATTQLGLESRPIADPNGPVRIRIWNSEIPEVDRKEDEFILTHAEADCLNPQLVGTRVFFYSEATNLVPNDNNGVGDIFVYDQNTQQVELVSCLPNRVQLNAKSEIGHPSSDGRYYAFSTRASNGYAGDTNNASDVFVKDLSTGELLLISRPSPAVGGIANGDSGNPTIMPQFNGVIFQSNASNLVRNDTNNGADIFYWAPAPRNRVTTRINFGLNLTPVQGGTNTLRQCVVSAFGSHCAYTSDANVGVGPAAGPVHLYRSLCVYGLSPDEAALPNGTLPNN